MNEWEFLIQKEGDRSWLPLDSPDVEILEGRYRMVARSRQPNLDVELRISHLATDEVPPKRRMQKRLGHTNASGLMVIIPYTQLRPGVWDFCCNSSDTMAHLLGQPWSYAVRLQVLAHTEAEDWEDPDPVTDSDPINLNSLALPLPAALSAELVHPTAIAADPEPMAPAAIQTPIAPIVPELSDPEQLNPELLNPELEANILLDPPPFTPVGELPAHPIVPPSMDAVITPETRDLAALNLEMAQVLGMSMEDLIGLTEKLSQQILEETFQGVPLSAAVPTAIGPTESKPALLAGEISTAAITEPDDCAPETLDGILPQIILNQTSWVAQQGATIVVNGYVGTAEATPQTATPMFPEALTHGQLAGSPVPDEAVLEVLRSPSAFNWQLELVLRDPQTATVLVQQQQPLTSQTWPVRFQFSVPLPHHLNTRLTMGEVRLQALSPTAATITDLASQPFTVTLDPERLMAELTQLSTLLTNASDDQVLPDSLRHDWLRSKRQQSLDLSFLTLAEPPIAPPQPPVPVSNQRGLPPQLHPTGTSKKLLDLPSFGLKPHQEEELEPIVDDRGLPLLELPQPEIAIAPEVPPAAPSSEAADLLLPSHTPEVDQPIGDEERELSPVELAFQALNLEERFFQRLMGFAAAPKPEVQEFATPLVVSSTQGDRESYEFVVEDELDSQAGNRSQVVASPAEVGLRELSPDQPIPTPQLQVTTPELMSGGQMEMRVSLPDLRSRLYVKLWVSDRQTRTMLDGPHWLMEFRPNGHGLMETKLQLPVPLGTVEIQVEAIAVAPDSNREGRKVSVDLPVLPVEEPELVLDELDLYSIIR